MYTVVSATRAFEATFGAARCCSLFGGFEGLGDLLNRSDTLSHDTLNDFSIYPFLIELSVKPSSMRVPLVWVSQEPKCRGDVFATAGVTQYEMTAVGFEPTPFRNGALSHRLRPLGQTVLCESAQKSHNTSGAQARVCRIEPMSAEVLRIEFHTRAASSQNYEPVATWN